MIFGLAAMLNTPHDATPDGWRRLCSGIGMQARMLRCTNADLVPHAVEE
ncbi:hypothetical protein GbCGDNIH7_8206 [Granulibacter bethesdensis]|nr:hypothetical protein GbCGDNIH7_8206 [Granulibacter bethesdensis]